MALVGGPRLTAPSPLADGSVRFALNGIAGWTYSIQASTNFADWMPLATFVATNSTAPLVDAAATNYTRRFYRAVAP